MAGPLCHGAIWPEEFFGYERRSVRPAKPGEGPVWEEYGFEEGETARYEHEGKQFTATGYRFHDATSAMSVYLWKRPAGGVASPVTALAVELPEGLFFSHGNYVFRFEGFKPDQEQVVGMLLVMPMMEQSALPSWVSLLPRDGIRAGTERFVIGPAGLAAVEPRVPPSVAGFHYGVEASFADFASPKGDVRLGVFSYPTPHIARERLTEFRMLPGVVVKRTGPLLAVVFDPADPDEAQKLLGQVNYRATITWDERSFDPGPSIVEIVLTAFLFIGGLLLCAVVLGGVFGGVKFWRWSRQAVEEDPMILLHIEDK